MRTSHTEDEEATKKYRGRQSGAKSNNKSTLFKIISQFKPTNMVTIPEQYRIACGELESRQPTVRERSKPNRIDLI